MSAIDCRVARTHAKLRGWSLEDAAFIAGCRGVVRFSQLGLCNAHEREFTREHGGSVTTFDAKYGTDLWRWRKP